MEEIAHPPRAATETGADSGRWSFPRRLISLFMAPRALFEELERRPSWLVPTLVFLAITVGFVLVLWDPVIVPEQLTRLEEAGNDQAVEMMTGPVGKWISVGAAALGSFASVFLYALGVFLVGGFLLGGSLSYRQALAIVSHASLVAVPAVLLRLPLAFVSKTSQITLGPGAFFPPSAAEGFGATFLAYFLTSFDLFTLWQTALVALGTAVIGRLPMGRAALGIWALFLFFAVLMALLGSMGALFGGR